MAICTSFKQSVNVNIQDIYLTSKLCAVFVSFCLHAPNDVSIMVFNEQVHCNVSGLSCI